MHFYHLGESTPSLSLNLLVSWQGGTLWSLPSEKCWFSSLSCKLTKSVCPASNYSEFIKRWRVTWRRGRTILKICGDFFLSHERFSRLGVRSANVPFFAKQKCFWKCHKMKTNLFQHSNHILNKCVSFCNIHKHTLIKLFSLQIRIRVFLKCTHLHVHTLPTWGVCHRQACDWNEMKRWVKNSQGRVLFAWKRNHKNDRGCFFFSS